MAEQKNKETIVFLPWVVEPQAQTQAVILENSKEDKIYVDLAHSTDTTAMKSFEEGSKISIASFDYATGIAVFLALCATGLAYWFGARSFILTKQSFDAVIEQIGASMSDAKNHKDITIAQINAGAQEAELNKDITIRQLEETTKQNLETNRNLIFSHHKLSLNASRQDWINSVRQIAIEIISLLDQYSREAKKLSVKAYATDHLESPVGIEKLNNLDILIKNIREKYFSLELFLNPGDPLDNEICVSMTEVLKFLDLSREAIDMATFNAKNLELITSVDVSKDNIQIMLKQEWEKVKVTEE